MKKGEKKPYRVPRVIDLGPVSVTQGQQPVPTGYCGNGPSPTGFGSDCSNGSGNSGLCWYGSGFWGFRDVCNSGGSASYSCSTGNNVG